MIRAGVDGDGTGYRSLIAACWGEYESGEPDVEAEIPGIGALATALAAQGGALWTADEAGAVVGMVATYPAEDAWHLSRMYVAAGQRGTGLATRLLVAAEDHARAAGARRMVLWSDVLFTRAHAFYEKHGYLRRGGLRPLGNPSGSIEAGYAKPLAGRVVEELDIAAAESAERPLAPLMPLEHWREITRAVGQGRMRLFAAWRNGVLAGTVQLWLDMPQDGRHRAELRQLLVAPGSRCRGLARLLLTAAEDAARQAGRSLLVLDARVDDHAEPLYRQAGWLLAGIIPGHRLDGAGRAHGTRVYYKPL